MSDTSIRGLNPLLEDLVVEEDENTVHTFTPNHEQETKKKEDMHMGDSDYYWNSYAHFGIHEEMLKDHVRTDSYRRAIFQSASAIKDRIVLDIGCGTGILSLFAVQAGAEHVYAIDNSSIIEQARQIAADNGMADKITFIRGKAEEIELPVDKVDVILSEWMGYFLVYESMMDTVIYARDKWLKKDGYLLPDRASISICGIEDEDYKEEKIAWWNRVWGYDMSSIKKLTMLEPLVDTVSENAIVTDHCSILSIDLYNVKKEELDFRAPFRLKGTRQDACHAFVVYFDIWFTSASPPVHFSTGPHAEYTHWKQTVFYLEDVLLINDGEEILGALAAKPNARNHRDIDIAILYKFKGAHNNTNISQSYFLR